MFRQFYHLNIVRSNYLVNKSTQPGYRQINLFSYSYWLFGTFVILICSLLNLYGVVNSLSGYIGLWFGIWTVTLTTGATVNKKISEQFLLIYQLSIFAFTFAFIVELVKSNFSNSQLVYIIPIIIIFQFLTQRFKASLIYSGYVISLLLFSYLFINSNQPLSKLFIFLIFFLISSVINVFYFVKDMQYYYLRDRIDYLSHVNSGSIYGFVLCKWEDLRLNVVEISDNIESIFQNSIKGKGEFEVLINQHLGVMDKNVIHNMANDYIYTKVIAVADRMIEVKFSRLQLRFNSFITLHCNDVTDHLTEKQDLILREQKYRNLYNKNQAGVFTLNKDAVLMDCNTTFIKMFDNTIHIGEMFFKEAFFEDWEELIDIVTSKHNLKNYQTQIKLHGNSSKWFIFNFYYDVQTDFIEGTVVDVTEVQRASIALRQSEEKYRLIYEESNDVILLLKGDEIIDVNRRGVQLFGIPEEDLIKHSIWDLTHNLNTELKEEIKRIKERISLSRITKFNWKFKGKFAPIDVEVAIAELVVGSQVYHQWVIHDITERLNTINVLERTTKNFQNVLENMPEGILIIQDNKMVYSNEEATKLLKTHLITPQKLFIPEDQMLFNKSLNLELIKQNSFHQKLKLHDSSEENERIVDVTVVATEYENQDGFLVIMKDNYLQHKLDSEIIRAQVAEENNKRLEKEISERVRTEKMLENLLLKTKSIYDSSSNNLVMTLDLNFNLTYFNSHVSDYFKDIIYNLEEGISYFEVLRNILPEESINYFFSKIKEVKDGKSFQLDLGIGLEEKRWLNIFVNPIYDIEGEIAEISLIAHDITNKKHYEQELKDSLFEKEILLKEIHHRVKNNLQVISSILNLQSNYIDDERTLGVLQESRNRIRSMSIIHENLYRTTNFASIDFGGYIKNLVTNLRALYYSNDTQVIINYDLDEVELILDQAVPCGLIMNELITNALKYAVVPGKRNVITLAVHLIGNQIEIMVKDNGVGLPVNMIIEKNDSLGLQLVQTLVDQLDGSMQYSTDNGTKFLITFEKQNS